MKTNPNAKLTAPNQGAGANNKWEAMFSNFDIYRAIDLDSNFFETEHDGKKILYIGQDYENGLLLTDRLCNEILASNDLAFTKTVTPSTQVVMKPLALASHFPLINQFMASYTPDKVFSPHVELFFKICIEFHLCYGIFSRDPNLYYPEFEKTGGELFNEMIVRFRETAGATAFKKMVDSRFRNVIRNLSNAENYVDHLLSRHFALELWRVDLGYLNANLGQAHTITIDAAHTDLLKFLNNCRSNKRFDNVVGYLWKRESGRERGVYFHFILFFATTTPEEIRCLKEAFVTYWHKIVGDLGGSFDCANSRNVFRQYGIGTLDSNNSEKRQELFLGLRQLFAKDFYLSDKAAGKHRSWRCKEWPRTVITKRHPKTTKHDRLHANGLQLTFDEKDTQGQHSTAAQIEAPRSTIMIRDVNAPNTVDLLIGHVAGSGEPEYFRVGTQGNPHLIIVGQPGMGKTHCLINLCQQLYAQGIVPIVFSYHSDIDAKLAETVPSGIQTVGYSGLGFNPMEVMADHPHAYLESVDRLRDVFAAIFPDLGEVQLGALRAALKMSYEHYGWSNTGRRGATPDFGAFLRILRLQEKVDVKMLNRLEELADYGFFNVQAGSPSLLDATRPTLVQIHSRQSETLQRAFATFVLYNLYQNMLRRGPQPRLTHAIFFDEAHRASKLKLIPTMAKESRKFGLSLFLASQEIRDFDHSLFAAVSNSLSLRLLESDAQRMVRNFGIPHDRIRHYADRMKQMPKYQALFNCEGLREPVTVELLA